MASVKWSDDALRDLEKIDQIIVKRMLEKVLWLEKNFEDVVPEKLRRNLKDLYKLRDRRLSGCLLSLWRNDYNSSNRTSSRHLQITV